MIEQRVFRRPVDGPGSDGCGAESSARTVPPSDSTDESVGQALVRVLSVPTGLIRNCGPWAVGWFGLIMVRATTQRSRRPDGLRLPCESGSTRTASTSKPSSVRRAVGWVMTDPARLDPQARQQLDAILAASPELTRLAVPVRDFVALMTQLRGRDLAKWMDVVEADDLLALLRPRPAPRSGRRQRRSHPALEQRTG